jgi:hypothetical protein
MRFKTLPGWLAFAAYLAMRGTGLIHRLGPSGPEAADSSAVFLPTRG